MSVLIFIFCFVLSFWITNKISRWFANQPTRCEKGLPCECQRMVGKYAIYARCENKKGKQP